MEEVPRALRNFKTCREWLTNNCECTPTPRAAWWIFTNSLIITSNSWWRKILRTTWIPISSRWCNMHSTCKKLTALLWNPPRLTIKYAPCIIKHHSVRQVEDLCLLEMHWTCQLSSSQKTIWIALLTVLNCQWIISITGTASGMEDARSNRELLLEIICISTGMNRELTSIIFHLKQEIMNLLS